MTRNRETQNRAGRSSEPPGGRVQSGICCTTRRGASARRICARRGARASACACSASMAAISSVIGESIVLSVDGTLARARSAVRAIGARRVGIT